MHQPPKWLNWIFTRLCRSDLWEHIQGDMEELYASWREDYSPFKANLYYAREVMGMLRPNLIKKFHHQFFPEIYYTMFKNYLKISVRSLWNHRFFSGINIFGLAISMSVCLLLLMLLVDQYSYDRFHANKDRLYRVISGRTESTVKEINLATAPMPIATVLKEEYPGVEEVVRIRRNFSGDGEANDKNIPVEGLYVDESFLTVFDFEWIKGDKASALAGPNSIVLTDETARKFFGEKDPLGKTFKVGEWGDFVITGLIEKPPRRSHIQFQVLTSIAALEGFEEREMLYPSIANWVNLNDSYTYFLMHEGQDIASIKAAIPGMIDKYYADQKTVNYALAIQAFGNISPGISYGNELSGGIPQNILFFLIGLVSVILASACFNYTNLSIARALTRAREVGIRKVVGAVRMQIVAQFLCEAIIIALLALGMASVTLEFLIPGFYNLHPELANHIELERSWEVYALFIGFSVLVGLIAGIIPAVHLSSFRPVQVLKGMMGMKNSSRRMPLRKLLTITQFTLSLVFIISVSLIYQQLNYMNAMDLGFSAENIVNVYMAGNDYEVVKRKFSAHKDVKNVSFSSLIPATGSMETTVYINPQSADSVSMAHLYVDPNYIENLELELLAGNNFPADASTEHEQYIILNEIAAKRLNYSENDDPLEALGQPVNIQDSETQLTIIGVVKSFHFKDTHSPLGPLMLRFNPNRVHHANLRLSSNHLPATLEELEEIWGEMDPVHQFDYAFFDEQVAENYITLNIMIKVIGFTALLAITLACLGLLGMATYTAETRLREVGIRKVLGANERVLIFLLSKGFLWLLGISVVIGLPVAYFVNQIWLQEFAFRIDINFGTMLLATSLLLGLGLLTIVSQTFRAAKSNPIEVLRND
jgi:putative ABC transport system permease protein